MIRYLTTLLILLSGLLSSLPSYAWFFEDNSTVSNFTTGPLPELDISSYPKRLPELTLQGKISEDKIILYWDKLFYGYNAAFSGFRGEYPTYYILESEDNGVTWQEVHYEIDKSRCYDGNSYDYSCPKFLFLSDKNARKYQYRIVQCTWTEGYYPIRYECSYEGPVLELEREGVEPLSFVKAENDLVNKTLKVSWPLEMVAPDGVSSIDTYQVEQKFNNQEWKRVSKYNFDINKSQKIVFYETSDVLYGPYQFRVRVCLIEPDCSEWTYSNVLENVVTTENTDDEKGNIVFQKPANNSQPNIASLSGILSINKLGRPNYDIPLDIPKPINNFAPNLALRFNDSTQYSEFGRGWDLVPKSMITYCNVTEDRSLSFDTRRLISSLCLDGVPLVLIQGRHGTSNAKYQLKNNAEVQATVINSSGSVSVSRAWEILVEYPDGRKLTYKTPNLSNVKDPVLALAKEIDKLGNVITYQWKNIDNCANCISSIKYGYNDTNSSNYYLIKFNYVNSDVKPISVFSGVATKYEEIIDNIDVLFNDKVLYKYDIKYKDIYDSGSKLYEAIESINRCDSKGSCLPPNSFEYNENNLFSYKKTVTLPTIKEYSNLRDFQFGDLDFDGDKDFVGLTFDNKVVIAKNNGNTSYSHHKTLSIEAYGKLNPEYSKHIKDIESAYISLQKLRSDNQYKKDIDDYLDIIIVTNTSVFISQGNADASYTDFYLIYDRSIKKLHNPNPLLQRSISKEEDNYYYLSGNISFGDADGNGTIDLIETFTRVLYGGGQSVEQVSAHERFRNKLGIPSAKEIGGNIWSDINVFPDLGLRSINYTLNGFFKNFRNAEEYEASARVPEPYLPATFDLVNNYGVYRKSYVNTPIGTGTERCWKHFNRDYLRTHELSIPSKTVSVNDANFSGFDFPFIFQNNVACDEEVFLADINSDGLTDKLVLKNGVLKYSLNRGSDSENIDIKKLNFSQWYDLGRKVSSIERNLVHGPQALANRSKELITFSDMNGDGWSDLVEFKSDGVYVSLFNGERLLSKKRWLTPLGSAFGFNSTFYVRKLVTNRNDYGEPRGESERAIYRVNPRKVVDVDGDGISDFVGSNASGTRIYLSNQQQFSLKSITDGLGNVHNIRYSTDVYEKDPQYVSYGLKKIIYPTTPLVSAVEVKTSTGTTKTSYKYSRLLRDELYRKNVGFLKVIEETNGKKIVSHYYNQRPFYGKVEKKETYINDKRTRFDYYEYKVVPRNVPQDVKPTSYKVFHNLSGVYDLYSTYLKRYESTSLGVTTSFHANRVDEYNNVLEYQECIPEFGCRLVNKTYSPNIDDWYTQRVETETYSFDGHNEKRYLKNEYQYQEDPNLPSSLIVSIDGVPSTQLNFRYDEWGNTRQLTRSTLLNEDKSIDGGKITEKFTRNYEQCSEHYPVTSLVDKHEKLDKHGKWLPVSTRCSELASGQLLFDMTQSGDITARYYSPVSFNLLRQWNFNRTSSYAQKVDFEYSNIDSSTPKRYAITRRSNYLPEEVIFYDSDDRWVERRQQLATNHRWSAHSREFNSDGLVKRESMPFIVGETAHYKHYFYDDYSRLERLERPSGNNLSFSYQSPVSAKSQQVVISDASGNRKSIKYDNSGRPIVIINSANETTTYRYDWFGINVIIDELSQGWVLSRDGQGNVRQLLDPYLGKILYTYNGLGMRNREFYLTGDTLAYQYDELGRLSSKVASDNSRYEYVYDELGRLKKARSFKGDKLTFEQAHLFNYAGKKKALIRSVYANNKLVEQSQALYTYNSVGQLDKHWLAGKFGSQNHYQNGYLSSITATGHFPTSSSIKAGDELYKVEELDALASISKAKLGKHLSQTILRVPETGKLKDIKLFNGSTALQHFEYSYDGRDLLSDKIDHINGRNESYYYDSMHRLEQLDVVDPQVKLPFQSGRGDGYTHRWSYDRVGNISDSSLHSYTLGDKFAKDGDSYAYPIDDHEYKYEIQGDYHRRLLERLDDKVLSYDARGQVIQFGDKVYQWNPYGQLIHSREGERSVSFDYSGKGERIKRVDQLAAGRSIETRYLDKNIEKNNVVTKNSNKTEVKFNIYAGSRLVATLKQTDALPVNVSYHSLDNLSSVAVTANENGQLTSRNIYRPFGKRHNIDLASSTSELNSDVIKSDGTKADNLGYTGHEDVIDMDLIHMNGRVYEPEMGRFLSPDPFIGSVYADQNLNRYSYVLNNPLSYSDPSGHYFWVVLGLGMTAYDVYVAYDEGGTDAALIVVAEEAATTILTGGAGKILKTTYNIAQNVNKSRKTLNKLETASAKMQDAPSAPKKVEGPEVKTSKTGKDTAQAGEGAEGTTKSFETHHEINTGGKAPKTSQPNSIIESKRADGSSSVTYYDDKGRAFSREDYGQQSTHGSLGRREDGRSVAHEHRFDYNERGYPIKQDVVREISEDGVPVGDWMQFK